MQHFSKTTLTASLTLVALLAGTSASAQVAGTFSARAGFTHIAPQVSSGNLSTPSFPGTTVDVGSASELAQIIAAVGLAQNFSALKALATFGVQKGHMALHAHNIAMMAGATGDEIDRIAKVLVAEGAVRLDRAETELKLLRRK